MNVDNNINKNKNVVSRNREGEKFLNQKKKELSQNLGVLI